MNEDDVIEALRQLDRLITRVILVMGVVMILLGCAWMLFGEFANGIRGFCVAVVAFGVWKIFKLTEDKDV